MQARDCRAFCSQQRSLPRYSQTIYMSPLRESGARMCWDRKPVVNPVNPGPRLEPSGID